MAEQQSLQPSKTRRSRKKKKSVSVDLIADTNSQIMSLVVENSSHKVANGEIPESYLNPMKKEDERKPQPTSSSKNSKAQSSKDDRSAKENKNFAKTSTHLLSSQIAVPVSEKRSKKSTKGNLENSKTVAEKDVKQPNEIRKCLGEMKKIESHQLLGSNIQSARKAKKTKVKADGGDEHSKSKEAHLKADKLAAAANKKDAALYRFPDFLTLTEISKLEAFGVVAFGEIRINRKNNSEAYVTLTDTGQDIAIRGIRDRNRALNGDEVYVLVKPQILERKDENLQCGTVVRIKAYNHNRLCIGTLSSFYNSKKKYATLLPNDLRLPRIKISTNLPPEFIKNPMDFQDHLFACRIISWYNTSFADGGFLEYLGTSGCAEPETKAILMKFDLDVSPYPSHFSRFYPPTSYIIPEVEISQRTDLRKVCVFTIDPATAKDLDDAVSCQLRPDGSYEIGVHIADVSYFLGEGTELDESVSKRATTVYLVNAVYHMLPRDLCSLCSLTPGEDKLTFSVIWEFSSEGEILSVRFEKTVINSCAQLSYEDVQGIIDGLDPALPPLENNRTVEDIHKTVEVLHRFAEKLREKRLEDGSLTLNNLKFSFTLDPITGLPVSYVIQNQLAAHRLIEEFMLLANRSVAEKLVDTYPDLALLRCHSPPKENALTRLQSRLEVYGMHLDATSSKTIQSSLKYICEGFSAPGPSMVVYHAMTKPMVRALYFCCKFREEEDRYHYALSFPLYTHFTSPIRRYADIIVHRQLAAALNLAPTPAATPNDIQRMAHNCNVKKYNAKLAGDDSAELFFSIYVGTRENYICEAVVSHVTGNNFECLLIENGILVKVYFADINGKVKRVEENGLLQAIIQWTNGLTQVIDIFSIVTLVLTRGKGVHVDATLVPPISSSSSSSSSSVASSS